MSRREDIVSCIDVTIMDRFAHRALPPSPSEIFPAFGAGAAVTPRGVLVVQPQTQDPDSGGSRTGHSYSLHTSRRRHVALRASLSLTGLKAGVSRGEMG